MIQIFENAYKEAEQLMNKFLAFRRMKHKTQVFFSPTNDHLGDEQEEKHDKSLNKNSPER